MSVIGNKILLFVFNLSCVVFKAFVAVKNAVSRNSCRPYLIVVVCSCSLLNCCRFYILCRIYYIWYIVIAFCLSLKDQFLRLLLLLCYCRFLFVTLISNRMKIVQLLKKLTIKNQ